jgi:hypothetical protein
MKLAAKFARQETEAARLARIRRRRISGDRQEAVRRMLNLPDVQRGRRDNGDGGGTLACPECGRAFKLPMHLGRHRKTKHLPGTSPGAQPRNT